MSLLELGVEERRHLVEVCLEALVEPIGGLLAQLQRYAVDALARVFLGYVLAQLGQLLADVLVQIVYRRKVYRKCRQLGPFLDKSLRLQLWHIRHLP